MQIKDEDTKCMKIYYLFWKVPRYPCHLQELLLIEVLHIKQTTVTPKETFWKRRIILYYGASPVKYSAS